MCSEKYDVTVVGAGCSGICAAIQSAKSGCKTLLIEKNGISGGTLTVAGVNYPGLFSIWGKQIISGIGWDLVKKTLIQQNQPLPDLSSEKNAFNHYKDQIRINPLIFSFLADEELICSGVNIKFHTMVGKINRDENNKEWKMTLCGKDGLYEINSKFIIDCTGDANIVKIAGYEVIEYDECQPGTMCVDIGNYDPKKVNLDNIRDNFEAEMRSGKIFDHDCGWGKGFQETFLTGRGWNNNHIKAINAGSSEGKTRMELAGHSSILRMIRFFNMQPGLKDLEYNFKGFECGVRETRVIVGEKMINVDQYVSGYKFPDAVCYSFYPIDLHCAGKGITRRYIEKGVVPIIPLGALIPKGATAMLSAGRIISSDRLSNSALRVQATCMATGQAAGAAAALSIKSGLTPKDLDINVIHKELLKNGAIVPN